MLAASCQYVGQVKQLTPYNDFILAGVDYSPLSTTTLAFDSSMLSHIIPIEIKADQSDEIGEDFAVVIENFFLRDATRTEVHLSGDERNRIRIAEGRARARVHIFESKLSTMNPSMVVVL